MKDQIRALVADGKTDQAINGLLKFIDPGSTTLLDEVSIISGRLKIAKREYIIGHIGYDKWIEQQVKTMTSILDILESYIDSNLIISSLREQSGDFKQDGIDDSILIICQEEKKRKDMFAFFKLFRFNKIETVVASSYAELEQKAGKGFVIAIWDNLDLKACQEEETLMETGFGSLNATKIEQRVEFMKDCLYNDVASYYLHYGEPLFLVSEKRDWIYSANSRFALIGRLKEMLDYIKAYGG